MKVNCDGCGRCWRLGSSPRGPALVRCPYDGCRCSFLVQTLDGRTQIERARRFFTQRAATLRAQFWRDSSELRAEHMVASGALAVALSLTSITAWVGLTTAFFLGLAAFPWLFCLWNQARPGRALRWLYAISSLLVASALTDSPRALWSSLPEIAASLLWSALLIAASALVGWSVYRLQCHLGARQFAAQALQREKLTLAQIVAREHSMPPYR